MEKVATFTKILMALALVNYGLRASAQGVYDSDLIQEPSISMAQPGFSRSQVASFSPNVENLSKGLVTVPFPVAVPTEFTTLNWSFLPSYSGANGLTEWGQGWSAEFAIYRYSEKGDFSYENDEFTSPWGVLVKGNDGNFYPKGLSTKTRIIRAADQNEFLAYLEDGRLMVFGEDAILRTEKGIYMWYLKKIIDQEQNEAEISYFTNDSGRYFLSSVSLGKRGRVHHKMKVIYTTKLEHPIFIDFRSGQRIELDRVVDQVSFYTVSDGSETERWSLDFELSSIDLGKRLHLVKVAKTRNSEVIDRPITFKYGQLDQALATSQVRESSLLRTAVEGIPAKGFYSNKLTFYDKDNDGRLEIERADSLTTFRLENGVFTRDSVVSREEMDPECASPNAPSLNSDLAKARILVRFQGGKSPYRHLRIQQSGEGAAKQARLAICTIEGKKLWATSFEGMDEADLQPSRFVRIADLNNDSKPDWIKVTSGGVKYRINLSSDESFLLGPLKESRFTDVQPVTFQSYFVNDLNGDGLVDIVAKDKTGFFVYYGKGDLSFGPQRTYLPLESRLGNPVDLSNSDIVFLDINRDGLSDVVTVSSSTNQIVPFINQVDKLKQIAIPALANRPLTSSLPRVLDLEGQGGQHIVYATSPQMWRIVPLHLPETGLLTSIDDGKGSKILLGYKYSDPVSFLDYRPVILSRISQKIGFGRPKVREFTFGKGATDQLGRLIGFGDLTIGSSVDRQTISFDIDEDFGPVIVRSAIRDLRLSQAIDEVNNYQYIQQEFAGIKARVLEKETKFYDAGVRKTSPLARSYSGFNGNLCAGRILESDDKDSLLRAIEYSDPDKWSLHMHCLVGTEALIGTHMERSKDFSLRTVISRNANGQVVAALRANGTESYTMLTAEYDSLGRLQSLSVPGRGATRFNWSEQTDKLKSVVEADGSVSRVDEFDRSTLKPLTVQRIKGTSQYTMRVLYDKLERVSHFTDSMFSSDLSSWLETYLYTEATDSEPAIMLRKRRINSDMLSPLEMMTATFYDQSNRLIASFTKKGDAWHHLLHNSFDDGDASERVLYAGESFSSLDEIDQNHFLAGIELSSRESSRFGLRRQTEMMGARTKKVEETDYIIDSDGYLNKIVKLNSKVSDRYVYDSRGKEIRYYDAGDGAYRFESDALGRLWRVTLPDQTNSVVTYDNLGGIASIRQSNIGVVSYSYDSITRLLKSKTFRSIQGELDRVETYFYDGIGRMIQKSFSKDEEAMAYNYSYNQDPNSDQYTYLEKISSGNIVKSFKYLSDGKVKFRRHQYFDGRAVSWTFEYNPSGEIKREEITLEDGRQNIQSSTRTFVYDSRQQIQKVIFKNGELEMVYDEYGRIRRAQFSDRRSVTFEYDADSQKMASYYGNDSRPDRWSFGWSYNVDGQIESESLFLPASGAALSRYRYNSLQYLESTLRNQSASYLYDEVGLTRTLASSIIDRSNAVIRKGTNQWTMDLFGRIVRKNDLGMVYNGQGRLKKVKLANGQDVTYYHDENSHLVFREGEVDGGNLYLAEEVLSDGKNLIEKFSIGGLFLGRIRNGSFEFSPVDRVGTPLSTFGDSDSWHDPFGKGKVTDIRLDFGFAGLVRDPLTGFVNMGVRDYEPELGQFTTPDPLYFEEPSLCLESPVECNLYSYAKNNPLKYVDPTGTSSAEISIRRFENLVLKGESSKAMAEAKVRAAGAAGGLGGSLLVGAATGANFGAAVGASSQVVRTAAIELTSAAWLNAGAAGSYAASRAQSLTQSVSYYAQSTYRQVASFEIVFQDKYKSSALGSIGSAALGLFGESSPDALSNRIDLANALLSLADKEKIMTFANNFNASVEGLGRLMQVSFGPSLPKFDISNVNLENFDLPAEQNP